MQICVVFRAVRFQIHRSGALGARAHAGRRVGQMLWRHGGLGTGWRGRVRCRCRCRCRLPRLPRLPGTQLELRKCVQAHGDATLADRDMHRVLVSHFDLEHRAQIFDLAVRQIQQHAPINGPPNRKCRGALHQTQARQVGFLSRVPLSPRLGDDMKERICRLGGGHCWPQRMVRNEQHQGRGRKDDGAPHHQARACAWPPLAEQLFVPCAEQRLSRSADSKCGGRRQTNRSDLSVQLGQRAMLVRTLPAFAAMPQRVRELIACESAIVGRLDLPQTRANGAGHEAP